MSKKHEKKEKVTFGQVIQVIQDTSKPVPPKYLYKLSDVAPGDLSALKAGWAKVPNERRVNLLEDILEFIETDEVLDYSEMGKLAIADQNSKIRELGIRILAPYEMVELIPTYINMVQHDPITEVRAITAAALGVFVYLGEIEELDPDVLVQVQTALTKAIAEDQPELLRRRSLEALSYSSLDEITSMIEVAYQRPETDWVVTALNAMSRNLDERWNPSVIKSLKDIRPPVRAEAAHAAGEMELQEAREILLEMMNDDNPDVQTNAIWSLSQIGGDNVLEAMEKMLEETKDDDLANLLEEAIENLEFTQGVSALDFLDIDDDDEEGPFDEDSFLSKYSPNGRKPN